MCERCEKVKLREAFPTPKAYLDCLAYIQFLVDSGSFQFEFKSCDTDKVKDENGCWANDVIRHVIKCKNCGQCFACTALTYRGSGSFRKGKCRISAWRGRRGRGVWGCPHRNAERACVQRVT